MLHFKKRLAAFLVAAGVAFTAAGCADTSWSVYVDGTSVPAGVYLFFLMSTSSNITQNGGSSAWSQKIDNTEAATYAMNTSAESAEEVIIVENLAKKEGITLSADEKTTADSQASTLYSNATYTEKFQEFGVSLASLNRVAEYYSLRSKLYDKWYGDKGTKTVSDDAYNKYAADYVRVKHILITTQDDTGATLDQAGLDAAKKKADDLLAQAQSDPTKFDELAQANTADAGGLQQYPDGYTFKKDTTEYVQAFVDEANKLKVGEMGVCQSDYGYHVMYRLDLDKTSLMSQYKQELFTNDITAARKAAKVEKNDALMAKYKPQDLSLS